MMLEQEWLSSTDPQAMLDYLNGMEQSLEMPGKKYFMHKPIATDRKLRLLCHALMAPLGPISDDYPKLPDQWLIGWFGPKVQEPEQVALLLRLLFNPFRRVELLRKCLTCGGKGGKYAYSADDPLNKLMHGEHWYSCGDCVGKGTVGNFNPAWLTPQVLSLAQSCYDLRDHGYFPLIWDALETAECNNEEIEMALKWMGRCVCDKTNIIWCGDTRVTGSKRFKVCGCNGTGWVRLPGEPMMVRGFWVVDLLLGKE